MQRSNVSLQNTPTFPLVQAVNDKGGEGAVPALADELSRETRVSEVVLVCSETSTGKAVDVASGSIVE